jgi:hypothetical protein
MRWPWIVLAGLAAGLVFNLSGIGLVHLVLGRSYVEALLAHVPGPPGPGTALRHLGIRFGFGILSVLLYALLRPSYASGLVAACASGTFLFLAGYLPLSVALNEFGILQGWRFWVALPWGLAEAVLATLVGASVYAKLAGPGA